MDEPIWLVVDGDMENDNIYVIDSAFTHEGQAYDRRSYLRRTKEPKYTWEIICTDLTSPAPEGY
jgi:hypothetical protein